MIPGELRAVEARAIEVRFSEECAIEVRAGELRIDKVRLTKIGAGEADRPSITLGVPAPDNSYGGLHVGADHTLEHVALGLIGG